MGLFRRKEKQQEEKQSEKDSREAVLTLYSVTLEPHKILEVVKKEFSEVTKSIQETDENYIINFNDNTQIKFSLADNIDYVKTQTNGMMNFFAQAPLENKELLNKVLLQINIFTCITGITFELNNDERRTNYIINAIYIIAKETQSLILYPNMSLYSSEGELILSIEGKSDLEKYYPISSSDILKRNIDPSDRDKERYQRIITECNKNNISHTSQMLKSQIMEEEVKVPSVEEIAKRATAVFVCALYAECLLVDDGSIELAKKEFELINERYEFNSYLSEEETEYIKMDSPDRSTAIKFSWQYERCAVMLWSLGLMDLKKPTQICDVREIAKIIRTYSSLEELVTASNRKTKEELLEMQTLILYYNWACVEARINDEEAPAGLDPGVVNEQHYTLNWLISANGECKWDDISPNT